ANLICATLGLEALHLMAGGPTTPGSLFWDGMVQNFAYANGVLGLFNLLPGTPLDGGHVLEAGLSYVFDRRRAAMISPIAGVIIAIGLGVLAATRGFVWTVFIAGLLGLTAWNRLSRLRAAQSG